MKKIVITLVLFFTGSISFAQETQTVSKCQSFISSVFGKYNLPLPEGNALPLYVDSNLEKYNQEKPEFMVVTWPIEIKKQAPYIIKDTLIVKNKDQLKIEGKILEDGSYALVVSEIDSRSKPVPNIKVFYNYLDVPMPLIHTFHFSENCEFNSYHVRQQAGFNMRDKGFYVSANMQCEFNEPGTSGEDLTAHIIPARGLNYKKLISGTKDYMILKYPGYYRGLCALAKNNETTAL